MPDSVSQPIIMQNAILLAVHDELFKFCGKILDGQTMGEISEACSAAINRVFEGNKSSSGRGAAVNRWFMAKHEDTFGIANLAKKQLILFKPGFITVAVLEESTWKRNVGWVKQVIRHPPSYFYWMDIQSEEGKKWRKLLSRWRTMAKCPLTILA